MQTRNNNILIGIGVSILAMIIWTTQASAQMLEPYYPVEPVDSLVAPEGFEYVDSLVYVPVSRVDTAYVGKRVFDLNVRQSAELAGSMNEYIKSNPSRAIAGFRVRIFFDNKQSAKVESEKTMARFTEMYRGVPAYRTYSNPYFKVTVGDCRTKSEAMALLGQIKKDFPSAFVVKENICYPVLEQDFTYEIDTVKVLRPLALPEDMSTR